MGEHDVPLDDVLQGGRDAILQGVAPPPVHLPLRAEVLEEVLISDKGTEALLELYDLSNSPSHVQDADDGSTNILPRFNLDQY